MGNISDKPFKLPNYTVPKHLNPKDKSMFVRKFCFLVGSLPSKFLCQIAQCVSKFIDSFEVAGKQRNLNSLSTKWRSRTICDFTEVWGPIVSLSTCKNNMKKTMSWSWAVLEELHRFRPTLKIKMDEIDDLVNMSTAARLCLLTIACQKYVLKVQTLWRYWKKQSYFESFTSKLKAFFAG